MNLLSVYQMTHTGLNKRVTFTQNDVEISEVFTSQVVSVGFTDHDLRMYKFSHFFPYSQVNELFSHANERIKLWHEIYGHINYICLQSLSKERMVKGFLP